MSAFAHRGKADIVAGIAALASFSEKGVVLTGFALAHRSVSNTPGWSQNLQFLPKVSPQHLKNSRFAEKGSRDRFDYRLRDRLGSGDLAKSGTQRYSRLLTVPMSAFGGKADMPFCTANVR